MRLAAPAGVSLRPGGPWPGSGNDRYAERITASADAAQNAMIKCHASCTSRSDASAASSLCHSVTQSRAKEAASKVASSSWVIEALSRTERPLTGQKRLLNPVHLISLPRRAAHGQFARPGTLKEQPMYVEAGLDSAIDRAKHFKAHDVEPATGFRFS